MAASLDRVMEGHPVTLWWIPVGAGGRVVIHTSRWWERLRALREHRPQRPLFHAALAIVDRGERHVIEMTPAWGNGLDERGVVATGPVGLRMLGRSRFFRYEVRCWRDGVIPDLAWAVGGPRPIDLDEAGARAIRDRVADVPCHVWGRDALGIGDMWNSNSLIAWLLQSAGVDATTLHPPEGGDAPGWRAGIAAARTPVR